MKRSVFPRLLLQHHSKYEETETTLFRLEFVFRPVPVGRKNTARAEAFRPIAFDRFHNQKWKALSSPLLQHRKCWRSIGDRGFDLDAKKARGSRARDFGNPPYQF